MAHTRPGPGRVCVSLACPIKLSNDAAAEARAPPPEEICMKRYVMANRADGLADVVFEDDLEANFATNRFRELWLNTETPADQSDPRDPVADQAMIHEPPDGGAVFRMLVFPPKHEAVTPTPEQMIEMHKTIHSAHIPSLEYLRAAKHVTMHRTDTLNYFVLTEGELWSLSEGKDVLLKAGDVMIQRGCMHGWRNDSDRRAVLAAVLIDAKGD